MLTIGKPFDDMNLSELAVVRVAPFLSRLLIYAALVTLFGWMAVGVEGIVVPILGIIGLGLMYAHAAELQHQALHNTALPQKWLNRLVGFFLGLPLLVSFSDYQYSHLRHHRLLGTNENREFFNYGYDKLLSLRHLIPHLFMVRHYLDVVGFMLKSPFGWTRPDVQKREAAVKIRNEYIWMGAIIVLTVAASIYFKSTAAVNLWLLPLLVGIPAHAIIELPEHWNKKHDTLDVAQNTRTINASWFGQWYTNMNNFHVEHHWLPSLPNDQYPKLHRIAKQEFESDPNYWSFYKSFLDELYRSTFNRPKGASSTVS